MRLAIFLFVCSAALTQPLTIGVKGALRATSDLQGDGTSESKPYRIGPMAEVRLPWHFSFEADALYSRFGYSSTTTGLLNDYGTQRSRANSWEFPLLLKYHPRFRAIHPYVLGGVAPRHAGGRIDYSGVNATTLSSTGPFIPYAFANTWHANDHAFVVGGGVDFRMGHLQVEPEIRYLRWNNPLYAFFGSRGYQLLVPQNEVQILVGIGWGGR